MTDTFHARGINQYNSDTLEAIARDLDKNPKSRIEGTWEHGRLKAIREELKRRRER